MIKVYGSYKAVERGCLIAALAGIDQHILSAEINRVQGDSHHSLGTKLRYCFLWLWNWILQLTWIVHPLKIDEDLELNKVYETSCTDIYPVMFTCMK